MSFGKPSADFHECTLDESETEQTIKHALDLGINFIDMVNCYFRGASDEFIGRAIKKNTKSEDVVFEPKVYLTASILRSVFLCKGL